MYILGFIYFMFVYFEVVYGLSDGNFYARLREGKGGDNEREGTVE